MHELVRFDRATEVSGSTCYKFRFKHYLVRLYIYSLNINLKAAYVGRDLQRYMVFSHESRLNGFYLFYQYTGYLHACR